MNIIDLHQDFLSHIRFREQFGQSEQTSISQLRCSDVSLFVATAFPLPANGDQLDPQTPQLITEELEMYQDLAEKENITIIKSASDLDTNQLAMLLHIEGLNTFSDSDSDWRQLESWIKLGVRSIGTHWNIDNQLGGGTLNTSAGLTSLGGEVVSFVEQNNLLLDMAHMGRQTFADVAAMVSRPLYVSHGNADVLCSNVRNYTDQQLKMIADSGGVIGVFFANTFVVGSSKSGTIDDVINHIKYIKDLIGIDHIALGSDFGGIVSGTVAGLVSVADYKHLHQTLFLRGFSEIEIEKICWQNADRVLSTHLA